METTKKREIVYIRPNQSVGTMYHYTNGILGGTFPTDEDGVIGSQTTTSSGHPWPPKGAQRDRDIGGDFKTEKTFYTSSEGKVGSPQFNLAVNVAGPGFGRAFIGTADPFFLHDGKNTSFPSIDHASTDTQLKALGTTAIARTIPTNPIAGAAQFLGELKRDGLPSLPGLEALMSKHRYNQKVGNENLNFEFAVKPFISDLKNFGAAVKDSEKILKQYKRDSGRNVRRSYEFPLFKETTWTNPTYSTALPYGTGTSPALFDRSGVSYSVETVKSRRTWFSGCYTYYLDPGKNALDKVNRHAQLANKLFGVRITPELLWELTPWSWAIDWQTNLGDVISNFSAFSADGLVLRYGYIMEETSTIVTHTVKGLSPKGNGPTAFSESYGRIRKRRIAATPYGFGTNLGGLTSRQWAILLSLGISKGGFKIGM